MTEKWPERTFRFDLPTGRMPCLLARLRGAPARAAALTRAVAPDTLRRRSGQTWSVQENLGHLADIESLHLARLDELQAGVTQLQPADMSNRRTWEANHNAALLQSVLDAFAAVRATLVARLTAWPADRLGVAALHPRLKIPMRVIDLAEFTAEHDDYHLARMHELLVEFGAA
ncbi:MAG: DinB family protein [Phycisphaerae bacterium]